MGACCSNHETSGKGSTHQQDTKLRSSGDLHCGGALYAGVGSTAGTPGDHFAGGYGQRAFVYPKMPALPKRTSMGGELSDRLHFILQAVMLNACLHRLC